MRILKKCGRYQRGENNTMYGRKHSTETKLKLSLLKKDRYIYR